MSDGPAEELTALAGAGLLRTLRTIDSPAGPQIERDGRTLWNFASNDYLGLANHPALRDAFVEGIGRYGVGSAASRLVSGTLAPHARLEEALAEAKHAEAALTFSSGYAAAVGALPALAGKEDFLILDKLCHASLIDGAKLSGATIRIFPHNRIERLEELLAGIRAKSPAARVIVVTESVFSMDGDRCPLREIVELKDRHGALLFLDEAHAFGIVGEHGMGLAENLGLAGRIDFQMGTFSKAAGLAGAYIATSAAWREWLVNRARSFIYTTAPPPALAHATLASLSLIRSVEGAALREKLWSHIGTLAPGKASAIVPAICGSSEAALHAAEELGQLGLLVPAIRYPTVPRGTARLRISLSAAHPDEAIQALQQALTSLGLAPVPGQLDRDSVA